MHPSSSPQRARARARTVLASTAATTLACGALVAPLLVGTAAHAADATLLSQGKTATASSSENSDYYPASDAVDGDSSTRWSSAAKDGQWLEVDLGQVSTISRVDLQWEAAYASGFEIQVSSDNSTWTTVNTTTNGTGGNESVTVSGTGRYVRVLATQRATGYGISLWEFQVFGTPGGSSPTQSPTTTPTDPTQPTSPTTGCGTTDVALGKAASASSSENGDYYPAKYAVDGDGTTRWSSVAADPQWLEIDLGSSQSICGVELDWEGAYGKSFQVQTSTDGSTWTSIYSTTSGTGGVQKLDVNGTGRYLRVYGTARGTGYGYSLYEVKVYAGSGSTGSTTPPPSGNPVQAADPKNPDFGPNTYVFKPTDSQSDIQNTLNDVFSRQETNQFGTERDQFLFEPGTYDVQANIGFYTSINGVGQNPDDVNIDGGVWADAQWDGGNATLNFWRSVENLEITPSTGQARWAVAQAAPMRRVDIKGDLALDSSAYGWASGGYIADSNVSGTVTSYAQQQWYARDSSVGSWQGSLWNTVFSGTQGTPATTFPQPAVTSVPTTGPVREKPYLYEKNGSWAVFVPSLRNGTTGTTWKNGSTPGTSLGLDTFYLAHPGDSGATINQALTQGLNVLFTPGVYHLDQTIDVTRPDTVVMGLGEATIIPDNGVEGLKTADVDGIKIAGLLFDQGTTKSHAVVEVGDAGTHTDHASDPQSLQDVFIRIGGVVAGKADNGIIVNADDTIIDHIWDWRADHGAGVGWTQNTADYGLVVNGDDVNAYGLFVEHFQKYDVLWNGEGGRTIFFQNELAYDPPSAAAWSHDGEVGYAAYKVSDSVKTHEAWGLGSYCVFTTDPSIQVTNGFEVPKTPGVKLHSISTVSLGGQGSYAHVIDGTGPLTPTDTTPATVTTFGG